MKVLLGLLVSLFSLSAQAWDIADLFSGMSANVTPPGNYQDQAAGYYSGGGYSMRTKRGSFQPFALTPASLKMGCGGYRYVFLVASLRFQERNWSI